MPKEPRLNGTPRIPSSKNNDTINKDLTADYVIIGKGRTAAVNSLTLARSAYGRERVEEGIPILHIGHADPWTKASDSRRSGAREGSGRGGAPSGVAPNGERT